MPPVSRPPAVLAWRCALAGRLPAWIQRQISIDACAKMKGLTGPVGAEPAEDEVLEPPEPLEPDLGGYLRPLEAQVPASGASVRFTQSDTRQNKALKRETHR